MVDGADGGKDSTGSYEIEPDEEMAGEKRESQICCETSGN